MATVESAPVVGEQRILIPDVTWDFYKRFCEEIGESPIRLSFIDGMLEIMNTHSLHEFNKKILAKLIELTMFECNIPV